MKRKFLLMPIMAILLSFAPLTNWVQGQDEKGKIIASIDFDPKTDGFSFKNYGRDHDGANDLDVSDLILIFGAKSVCIEGSTPDDCVLYETADRWREEELVGMTGGHCDGFSVTTMRTWMNLPFRGKAQPKQWQPGAEVTNDLEFGGDLANYIAYYHILQSLKEVSTFRMKSFKIPPTGIVKLLIESFQTKNEFYTLGVGMRLNGKYTKGHSILPFAVEDMGEGDYRIHVYDNNFPGQTKFVTVDSNTETWHYNTASDPNDTAHEYVGDKNSQTFSLKKMSDRNLKKYACPFCEDNSTAKSGESSEGSANETDQIHFSFSGEGNLLITDPNGKQIGYDGQKKAEINQISGAEVNYNDGGLGLDLAPDYALPYNNEGRDPQSSSKPPPQPNWTQNPAYSGVTLHPKKPYQVVISGRDLKKEVEGNLEITAPGFVVGFEKISLDPSEELTVSISPDGEILSFTASGDGETPTIYVTTEAGPDKPSYSFEVGGVSLDAGKTLTMFADVEEGKVFFKDNDGNEDAYDVKFERTNADGTKVKFTQDDLDLKGKDSYEIDINKWDNTSKPCVKEDHDGDGFDDESCGSDKND